MVASIPTVADDQTRARLLEDPRLAELAEFASMAQTPWRRWRDEKIRTLYAAGVPVADLMAVTGLTDARIYQIMAGKNGHEKPRKSLPKS